MVQILKFLYEKKYKDFLFNIVRNSLPVSKMNMRDNESLIMFLCMVVFIFELISELIHDMFLVSPFDLYDIVITMVAQLSIFFIPIMVWLMTPKPIIIKDKYFSDYN